MSDSNVPWRDEVKKLHPHMGIERSLAAQEVEEVGITLSGKLML